MRMQEERILSKSVAIVCLSFLYLTWKIWYGIMQENNSLLCIFGSQNMRACIANAHSRYCVTAQVNCVLELLRAAFHARLSLMQLIIEVYHKAIIKQPFRTASRQFTKKLAYRNCRNILVLLKSNNILSYLLLVLWNMNYFVYKSIFDLFLIPHRH